jgi:uncharacterized protein YdaL
MDLVQVFWLVAGVGMLVFTIFLAVLVIAGMLFRLGPRTLRHRPAVVFGISTVLVITSTVVLVLPGSFHGATAATGVGVRYVDGGASGGGLPDATTRTLVLYDASGADPKIEELHATGLANLASHFGDWTAHPVERYRAGEMAGYDAAFYIGDPGGPALPSAFLADVVRDKQRIIWINGDIEQLQGLAADPKRGYGFTALGRDETELTRLEYKGAVLPMDPASAAGFTRVRVDDPKRVTVLATAWLGDGTSVPWAVRSGKLTYLSENPLRSQSYLEGRNTAFADLLFATLDPNVPTRHRALVRLEDVNPTTDPASLRAVVDYLYGQKVPFSIGLYPVFRAPNDTSAGPDGVTVRLSERPELVAALRYAIGRGGSLVLHGYTHQYGTKNNPLNGGSGDDTEFYLCHFDEQQTLQMDGPVPEDSEEWVLGRVVAAITELRAVGLDKPSTWEFSHYLASALDYLTVSERFEYRYERTLYFPGLLTGQPFDHSYPFGQLLPFAVRDGYGATVIPENLGYVSSTGDTVAGMLEAAYRNLVVRDGVASFFYHPYLGVGELPRMVDGLRAMGYSFVSAQNVADSS